MLPEIIVLASASPRRRELLEEAGMDFIQVRPRFDESGADKKAPPRLYVRELAVRKALSVAEDYKNALIIGADTVVVNKDRLLEKPGNIRQAEEYLRLLSGSLHYVYSGLCVVASGTGRILKGHEKTAVKMNPMDDEFIKHYVKKAESLDKAGGYAIQEDGDKFIEKISGSFYNVIGLPLGLLYRLLEGQGIRRPKLLKMEEEMYDKVSKNS